MPDLWMDVDTALSEVPVNKVPLIDDTDFKSREASVTYDQAGMDLVWNFVTTAGAFTQTAVTPTTAGDYDWVNQGDGMYTIEIPPSGGASINNDTEGFGWFTGVATGILPWTGPTIGFRASGINDLLIDSAYSATRGLSGTALPAAAADDVGGLPISDAGGLDLDALNTNVSSILTDTGTTLDNHLTDIKGTGFVKDTHSLINIEGYVDLIDDGTSGLAKIATDAAAILDDTGTNGVVLANDAITAAKIAADAIGASELAADAVTEIQAGLPTYDQLEGFVQLIVRKDAAIATDRAALVTAINADEGSGVGAFANTTDSQEAIRDHVGDGTNLTEAGGDGDHLTEAGGTGDQLTAIPWNAAWDAEVESEATDALNAYDPPTYDEVEGFVQLITRKDAAIATDRAALLTAINADEGSGAGGFDNQTDAEEALRDRGDAAWTTGGGGSITDILNVEPLIPNEIDLADTAVWRVGLKLYNALDDLPTTGEITPGTVDIDRKAIGGTSWTSVVSAAACSELAGLVYYDEVFDSGTGYAEGDSIRVTFKSQKITVAANDYEITDANGVIFYTSIRQTERGTNSAALAATALTNATWTDARAGYLDELAAANLPTDVAAVKSDTAAILLDTGTDGVVLTAAERTSIANAILDLSNGIETGVTPRQALRYIAAAAVGEASGAGTTTIVYKAIGNSATTRISGTVDLVGNRSSITLG